MTRRRRWNPLEVALLVGLWAGAARGQVGGVPVLSGVFPPGATAGRTTDWAISGRNLAKSATLRVSGAGVEVVEVVIKDESSATARVRVAPDAQPGFREIRLDGPGGVSNLVVVRVDGLEQVLEVEPNDLPDRAQSVAVGSAVAGVLKPLDLDHFRVVGEPGRRVTLDLEARRLGTSFAPVMTVSSIAGVALAQGRDLRGGDRDCRMTVVIPPDGTFVVQVRDNVYGGHDLARYRLRIDPAPFATALFPLGGPKGRPIEVELCGGNLTAPRRKSVLMPDAPGAFVATGDFDGGGGPVTSPFRLLVGDGPEIIEPPKGASPIEVGSGQTINGRIGEPGEVDAYRLKVKAGDRIRVRVEADSLGSWLDSVLAIRDEQGATLAENDDSNAASPTDQPRAVSNQGVPQPSPDSLIDYQVKADATLTIELTDRFGDGGPEYGYRLAIGPTRPDFSLTLLLGNANVTAQSIQSMNQARTARPSPGQFGVFNLKPGGLAPINFLVTPEGRPGPVEVRVEGLPDGVTAEPVSVRLRGPADPNSAGADGDAAPYADLLVMRVEPYVQPGLSEFRVVATSKGPGPTISREATATIGIDSVAVSNRPITRVLNRFSLKILGDIRPLFVGPPAPPMLRGVGVPGPLLQGDRIDLALNFSTPVTADDGSTVEARAEGAGLSTITVIPAASSFSDDAAPPGVVVHVQASARAMPGPHPVKVAYTTPGGKTVVHNVTVEVLSPIEVRPASQAIFLRPGDQATLAVEVRRAKGCESEVDVEVQGLPSGVKAEKKVTLKPGATNVELRLGMAADADPLAGDSEVRVVGVARMPRGNVTVDSKVRPMIRPRPADK